MLLNDIIGKSATSLVALMKAGEISSREVTAHFVGRIEAENPRLNAVVVPLFEAAMKAAGEADERRAAGGATGRLHGLPFTIKECFDYIGTPSTLGVLARRGDRPAEHDAYVRAFVEEGGIVLGKTNVPQLLIFIESVNRVYGRTNNPHDERFTCGGSSGGEGSIVGANASPAGLGSDIGGSVRFPAAFCGACSIKPTMRRTPDLTRYGATRLTGPIESVAGPIAQHAEDLDLFLRIMSDASAPRPDDQRLRNFRDVDVSRLRVGWFDDDGIFETMPAVKRAVGEAVETLRAAGAEIVRFDPPEVGYAEELFVRTLTIGGGRHFKKVLEGEKPLRQLRNQFMLAAASPSRRRLIATLLTALGQRRSTRLIPYFGEPLERIDELSRLLDDYRARFDAAMESEGIDAIVSPVAAVPAFLHESTDVIGLGGTYTLLYNVLGLPAGVARVSSVRADEAAGRAAGLDIQLRAAAKAERLSAGLPLAVQIAARNWREDIVIALIEKLHRRESAAA